MRTYKISPERRAYMRAWMRQLRTEQSEEEKAWIREKARAAYRAKMNALRQQST